jgi:RNA polymerase sigma-70 factor (TIGR02954 family)
VTENVLVDKARKGDEHALYSLILAHKEQLYKIAYSYLKNEQDSLEAIQEVTFRAFKSIRKLKESSYFSTWLIRIMMNYCNDELRKRKRTIPSGDVAHDVPFVENQHRFELEEAIDALDATSKQVLTLKYFQDFKIKEIADILECPEGTVKTWLNKALKKLRYQLDGKGGMKRV